MALTVKQRGVLKGIIVGATITFVVIVGAIVARPMVLSPEATVGERLSFALWADAFIVLWLGISIGMLARHRFFTPGGYRRRRTGSWLGNRQYPASHPSKHAGADGSGGAGAFDVGHSDARVLVVGDTSRRRSLLVWPSAICAWVSRRCGVSGGGVCAYLLPICSDAHRRGRCGRMEGVLLELIAFAANKLSRWKVKEQAAQA